MAALRVPVLSVVSVLGWSILAASILLWTAGQAFGWQEAKAAAIAACVLFLIAIGFILGRSSYGVVLDLARTRVAVGDSAVGSIAVSNTSARPCCRPPWNCRWATPPPSSTCPG
ncbi:conserved hypothetical protein [Arthrobacter sp. Hiyo4]|nr:conserved hypothetical protein [Arthrobacter sp. Hiyo4]